MYIDSYQVEIQHPVTQKWCVDACFHTNYRWRLVWRRWLCMPWRKRSIPEIIGDPRAAVLVVKAKAYSHARYVSITQRFQNIRIVRVERQGAQLTKFVVWQNNYWLEDWSSNE